MRTIQIMLLALASTGVLSLLTTRPGVFSRATKLSMSATSNQPTIPSWKKVCIATLSSFFLVTSEASAGFFTSQEQDQVSEIQRYQKPVAELLDQLRITDTPDALGVYAKRQILKGGKEDSDVVLNYLETYIQPLQRTMEQAATKLKLEGEAQAKVEVLPLLMKGHMLELRQAVGTRKAESQAKEVQEVQETLADFLKLAAVKYEVQPFVPSRPLTDAELFGPLGCEFWGKKRVVGSNYCEDIPKP
ncbi:hypothetical protein B484DRAFT_458309 [Ochromonadaceae sp. CCMP2298]|nr:hypothetical protein B484DRAFT_458309 [Ochromonadaceae sp. CCMP2298]|mmetsp:Transcript_4668/g.10484  ORF Transcript_4668/g.10484 Transcript_4668/m.10484 type:complete len:246 (-) Transcript_4668:210-947(-)